MEKAQGDEGVEREDRGRGRRALDSAAQVQCGIRT
jgi:hypothetical protein